MAQMASADHSQPWSLMPNQENVQPEPYLLDLPIHETAESDSQCISNDDPYSDTGGLQLLFAQASQSFPDSGHCLGSQREIGPPSSFQSDFPTPPLDILTSPLYISTSSLDFPIPSQTIGTEMDNSRRQPSPSASSAAPWQTFSTPGFEGLSNSELGGVLVDNHLCTNAPDPLQQWYTGNDEPWIPNRISAVPGERSHHFQGLVGTQSGLVTPGPSIWPPFPNALDTQLGLDIPREFRGMLYSQVLQCNWKGCNSRSRAFLNPSDLARHTETYHHKRCPSPVCHFRKPFCRRSDLNRHLRTVHSESRTHRCDFPRCGKLYARSDKLTAHKRTHGSDSTSPESNAATLGTTGPRTFEPSEKASPSNEYQIGASALGFEGPDLFSGVEICYHATSVPNVEYPNSLLPCPLPAEVLLDHDQNISQRPQLDPEQDRNDTSFNDRLCGNSRSLFATTHGSSFQEGTHHPD